MQVNNYFSHYIYPNKNNKVYVLVEHYSAKHSKTIGVLSGDESVIVINAGMGMHGDIRKYVEDMLGTDKTIECIALTGDPDNVGAMKLFDTKYIEKRQRETYISVGSNTEERKKRFDELACGNAETIEFGDVLMLDNKNIDFADAGHGAEFPLVGSDAEIKSGDGYLFHLGGCVVEMAELDAQSEGQLIAICSTCCITFTGKAIEPITDLSTLSREKIQRYADQLEGVIKYTDGPTIYSEGMGATPHVYFCESSALPMQVRDVQNILTACREVLDGDTEHDMPAGVKDTYRIHFVENNGIIYDSALLH